MKSHEHPEHPVHPDKPGSKSRVLFITKFREGQGGYSNSGLSSGLLNSCSFVSDMLVKNGVESKVVQVIDNNEIDREVSQYRPTIVIIEAVWVVPEKFAVLTKLHPTIKWVVRLHSNTPFLATEGSAFGWILQYLDYGPNVYLQANAHEMFSTIELLLEAKYACAKDRFGNTVDVQRQISHLPNYYPVDDARAHRRAPSGDEVQVSCFGAIRPLKDQMIQAIAAVRFAEDLGKSLAFHVNSGRYEGHGAPVRKNLQQMFAQIPNARLIEHEWTDHAGFIEVVKQIDVALQVSFTETFNIVVADCVNANIPVVVSSEISWVDPKWYAETTSVADIADKMRIAYHASHVELDHNKERLRHYSQASKRLWLDFVNRRMA